MARDRARADAVNPADAMDLVHRVRRLEDLEALRALQMRYQQALDAGDLATFAALFAPDGVWHGASGIAVGPEAIRELMAGGQVPGIGALFHVVGNQHLDVDGDEGTGRSAFVVLADPCTAASGTPAGGPPELVLLGTYRDAFVRLDGEWRFRSREAEVQVPRKPLHQSELAKSDQ